MYSIFIPKEVLYTEETYKRCLVKTSINVIRNFFSSALMQRLNKQFIIASDVEQSEWNYTHMEQKITNGMFGNVRTIGLVTCTHNAH